MYNQDDQLAMTRTRSGNSQRDFQDLLDNHEFPHENQKHFDYNSTTNMSTIQDYSQANYLDFDSNLVSEMTHHLEFAQPTKVINQPQGNTNNVTIGNTLSLLTNANEFNNNVPITQVTQNKPMNQEWNMIKNVPDPVQGIIQETLVLPPLQNCQHELDNHPIDRNNSNVASHALTPKNWKVVEDMAARIIKPSPPNDKNTLQEDNLFKTKPTIKKTKIGVSATSSSKANIMPRIIKTKSTQTEYTPINKKKLTLASRYSHLQSLLSTLEFMESIKHRTIEHSRINSSEKQAVLHEFNTQVAELNRDEVFKIQSLYSKRSPSKQKK